jgi:uncharacterized membrane protein YkvA (DUF1232 family)
MPVFDQLKSQAKRLKTELSALALAARDPRVPWYAKLLAVIVLAYAFSPIDLIPDFIPVLGYLDDLLLLPLGIWLVLRLIPDPVMADCRVQATANSGYKPQNWVVAAVIVAIWIGLGGVVGRSLMRVWQ